MSSFLLNCFQNKPPTFLAALSRSVSTGSDSFYAGLDGKAISCELVKVVRPGWLLERSVAGLSSFLDSYSYA